MRQPLYFPAIDGLRFLAFFLVFFRHFKVTIPSPFLHETGWIGVELFFLISGFLLTKLLKEEYLQQGTVHISNFFARRVLRIWPLYFFYLTAISVYAIIVGPHYFYPYRLFGNIFFYDNILSAIDYYNPNSFVMHLWSISMEEQYYLLLPFAIPWLLRQDRKKVIRFFVIIYSIMILCRVLAVLCNQPHPFIYVLPISGDCFLFGMMIGLGLFDRFMPRVNSLAAFGSAILLLATLYFIPEKNLVGMQQVYIYTIIALGFSLLLVSTIYRPHALISFVFTNKPVRYLGKISFGLYIYHLVAIYGAGRICEKLGLNPEKYQLILSFLFTIILAVLSYEFFEKFVLRYKKKFTIIRNREP